MSVCPISIPAPASSPSVTCNESCHDSAVRRRVQVIDDSQLDVGIVHNGNLARVRSFMHKLRSGIKVKMGARTRLQARYLVGHGLDAQGLCSSVLDSASCRCLEVPAARRGTQSLPCYVEAQSVRHTGPLP